MARFLAFDFGAESGRAVLGTIGGGKIELTEIRRVPNRPIERSGHFHWDFSLLLQELKTSLSATRDYGDLDGIGVDTWGVDFGLLDQNGELLDDPFSYRDSRTDGMMEKAFERMPRGEIYAYSGTQFMQLNTIYQLLSMVGGKTVESAKTLLFMPDLFSYFLSGETYSEYTIASTSQLLNAKKKNWEPDVFRKLGLPVDIMMPVETPGTVVGRLRPVVAKEVGLPSVDVIAPAGHDTASAVAAVPAQSKNWAYLSSGTWSLLGVELDEPIINEVSLRNNFTNEGGAGGKIRFLRNTMGLWLLQRCLSAWGDEIEGYDETVSWTEEARPFGSVVDPDDPLFLNPPDMPAAIDAFCRKTHQKAPETKGEYVRSIFESLALKYRFIIEMMNAMLDEPVEVLHVVGGGSRNDLLNQWSADATGLPVIAGPAEATAVGNILVQAIAKQELAGLSEGRRLVAQSFPLKHYEPRHEQQWSETYENIKGIFT